MQINIIKIQFFASSGLHQNKSITVLVPASADWGKKMSLRASESRRPSKQQQQGTGALVEPATSTSTPLATTTTSATAAAAAACCEASKAAAVEAADNETRFLFSLGDATLKSGPNISADSTTTTTTTLSTMTVSSGVKSKDEDTDMVSVEASDIAKESSMNAKDTWTCPDMVEDEEEEDGGRLSSEESEAINLCSKDLQPQNFSSQQNDVPMMSAKMRLKKQRLEAETAMWASSNDGLHKLAEAAERKQVSRGFFNIIDSNCLH